VCASLFPVPCRHTSRFLVLWLTFLPFVTWQVRCHFLSMALHSSLVMPEVNNLDVIDHNTQRLLHMCRS
jgi:hypothetical protein